MKTTAQEIKKICTYNCERQLVENACDHCYENYNEISQFCCDYTGGECPSEWDDVKIEEVNKVLVESGRYEYPVTKPSNKLYAIELNTWCLNRNSDCHMCSKDKMCEEILLKIRYNGLQAIEKKPSNWKLHQCDIIDKMMESYKFKETKTETVKDTKTEKKMSSKSFKETAKEVIRANKKAAILASEMEAGKIINNKLAKLLKKKLPYGAKKFADSEFFKVIIANVANVVVKQYASENKKLNYAADVMLKSASQQALQSLPITDIIEDFLDDISLPGFEDEDKPAKGKKKK